MRRHRSLLVLTPLVTALALVLVVRRASAAPIFGTLGNFDVVNDTGQETHGFEIELDGLSSKDVVYTFGNPCPPGSGCVPDPSQNYIRYGNPTVVDDPANKRAFVRYLSPFDMNTQKFTQATPIPPNPGLATLGHQCWGGGSADYATSRCEHFGVSLVGNPTNTIYRWLVADPAAPGPLKPSGSTVNIPAPVWNVIPPPPQPNPPPPIANAVF